MTDVKKMYGSLLLWPWGDFEIENPGLLKKHLLEITQQGFSGVLVTLQNPRYEFTDKTVTRTVAQVSQWAKKRHLQFWIQTDPRQASRLLITKTGERMQNLLFMKKPGSLFQQKKHHICKVENNTFELQFNYPQNKVTPLIQEAAIHYEPSGLESTFLFQIENDKIFKSSLRNITSVCQFYTNVEKGETHIFGKVLVPADEEWWVAAFPKYDTNLYDFSGRESNDLLLEYIENLFDACTHIDGLTWGNSGTGYIADIGYFPVSLSLYNSFIAEYGYDLRKVLYALLMEVDDDSHIRIRCDYFSLLMNVIRDAQKEYHRMANSFFAGFDDGIHHLWHLNTNRTNDLVQGTIDPWQILSSAGTAFTQIEHVPNPMLHAQTIISSMIISKSLGVYSKTQKVFFDLGNSDLSQKEADYWGDLMALYSLHRLVQVPQTGEKLATEETIIPSNKYVLEYNQKTEMLEKITEYRFPESNVLLVYPVETIMGTGSYDAEKIIRTVNQLIARMVLEGMQMDAVSSFIFKEGRLSAEGFRIRNRMYEAVVYPYPDIMTHAGLEIVSLMDAFGFPILLGGNKPSHCTDGKKIPHVFPLAFDPKDKNLTPLWDGGIKSIFSFPENCMGSVIQKQGETLLLLCPKNPGEYFKGTVQYQESVYTVPRSRQLVVLQKKIKENIKQLI